MYVKSWKIIAFEIAAAWCFTLGCLAVADMWIKLEFYNVFSINFLALCLVVGGILWLRIRANQRQQARHNWKQWLAIAAGVVALMLTCALPPFVTFKMDCTTFIPTASGPPKFYGYDCYFTEFSRRGANWIPNGERTWTVFDVAIGILEWEWLAVAWITAAAYLLLQTRTVRRNVIRRQPARECMAVA